MTRHPANVATEDIQWRAINQDYSVSSDGRVESRKHRLPKILSPGIDKDGYLSVSLCMGGIVRIRKIHALVAHAFIGPKPSEKHQINHKNGDKSDNRFVNLEWVTASENALHAFRVLGRTRLAGELHGRSKLSQSDVDGVRARLSSGEPHKTIAADYRVCRQTIDAIASGKRWQHRPEGSREWSYRLVSPQ